MATVNERITKIVNAAKAEQALQCTTIGTVSTKLVRLVHNVSGRNISGYTLVLDTVFVRHVLKKHPQVKMRDFFLLPPVVKSPDEVIKGNTPDVVVLRKDMGTEYACVYIVVDSGKKMRLQTFWFEKKRNK